MLFCTVPLTASSDDNIAVSPTCCRVAAHQHLTLWAHHTDTFKIALVMFDCSRGRCLKYFSHVYISVHTVAPHLQLQSANHGDIVILHARSTWFGCCSLCMCGPTIGTNFHRICEAQTLGNSSNVGFRAGYFSVHMSGGASERRWLRTCRINGLTDCESSISQLLLTLSVIAYWLIVCSSCLVSRGVYFISINRVQSTRLVACCKKRAFSWSTVLTS